jgi:copper chaperone NosL
MNTQTPTAATPQPTATPISAITRQRGFVLSTTLFIAAAALIVASIFFPYWQMKLNAPQYPGGLYLTVYLDHMQGDISEIDGLNHYIGMAPLGDAAQLERQLSMIAMVVIVLMVAATAFIHRKWFAPLVLPAVFLPLIFLADMYYWLARFGQGLDPRAALSNVVKPFTPTLLGHGAIGQFSTDATVLAGFWMAVVASIMILVGLHFRRQARLAAEREHRAESARAAMPAPDVAAT